MAGCATACAMPGAGGRTGRRTIRLFGGRKTMIPRGQRRPSLRTGGLPWYQQRQCNPDRRLFFIPGIRSINNNNTATTNSFYAMNAAIQKFETVGFLRGGRISGFLDRQRTPFYLTKKLMEVAHIDEQGRAVRVPQWIIDLRRRSDVTALLRENEDTETPLVQAQLATQVLQAVSGSQCRIVETGCRRCRGGRCRPLHPSKPPLPRDRRPSFQSN